MRRMPALLGLVVALLVPASTAWASIEPGHNKPPNVVLATCAINPGLNTVAKSAKPSSVDVTYRGLTCTGPAIGVYLVVGLWTQSATGHWKWTRSVAGGGAGGWILPNGSVTATCTHLATVKVSVAYYVHSLKIAMNWTKTARCS